MVTYWHGSHERSAFGCECSLGKSESECDANHNPIGTETYCNCDSLDSNNVDIGILTNMDQLPVTQLNYGDSQDRISWIQYDLGPLSKFPQRHCFNRTENHPSTGGLLFYPFKPVYQVIRIDYPGFSEADWLKPG